MNFFIAGTQSVAGRIGGFQLACSERVADYSDGSVLQLKINGTNVLDIGQYNTVLYQNFTVPIGTTGDTINYEPHDGPGQELGLAGLSTMYIGDGHPKFVLRPMQCTPCSKLISRNLSGYPSRCTTGVGRGTLNTPMELGVTHKMLKYPLQWLLTQLGFLSGITTQMTRNG